MNWNVASDKRACVVTAVNVFRFNDTVFLNPFLTAGVQLHSAEGAVYSQE